MNYVNDPQISKRRHDNVQGTITLTHLQEYVTAVSGSVITLPKAEEGKRFFIDNSFSGNIVVYPHSGDVIQDESSQIVFPDSCMDLIGDGLQGWRIT